MMRILECSVAAWHPLLLANLQKSTPTSTPLENSIGGHFFGKPCICPHSSSYLPFGTTRLNMDDDSSGGGGGCGGGGGKDGGGGGGGGGG